MLPREPCETCGVSPYEAFLGKQMAEMLADAPKRAEQPTTPDDPVKLLSRLATEYGCTLLVPVDEAEDHW